METWYELFNGHLSEVQVERSTENNIWINGCKRAKSTRFWQYFPSKREAYEYLIDRAESDVAAYQVMLQKARTQLGMRKKELQDLNQIDAFKD